MTNASLLICHKYILFYTDSQDLILCNTCFMRITILDNMFDHPGRLAGGALSVLGLICSWAANYSLGMACSILGDVQ